MQIRNFCTLVAATVATALYLSPVAVAAELVTNGDFETGDLTGWTLTGDGGHSAVTIGAGIGDSFSYSNTEIVPSSTITQSLTTIVGESYTFSFSILPNRTTQSNVNGFTATWAGVPVYTFSNEGGFIYQNKSFTVTATAITTDISFTGYNIASVWDLDNVSVAQVATVVPEAGTMTLTASLLALLVPASCICTVVRRKRAVSTGGDA
ncbi:MAG: hypothetical protein H7145_23775 [Akkermansiaceae bacterium]|nr:hypothetical protein [Armatimonadota bacterium]